MVKVSEQIHFNIFSFVSTFARSLIEIFISLYLFKNGYSVRYILIFYFLANLFAIPLSYIFVQFAEKTKYIYVMIIGLVAFVILQLLLRNMVKSNWFLLLISLLYSVYRRGYWVARRFYITKIMPEKNSSGLFSIVLVMSQLSSIVAGYVGSFLLSHVNLLILTFISSILLFFSVIPLFRIKYYHFGKSIHLKENLKKYDWDNYLVFSFYELNNLLVFIFPIYIALYVNNSYFLAGNLNAISNIAIILFIIYYGKVLNHNKNYLVISTLLVILCLLLKVYIHNYFILIVFFMEGIVTKMQNQSVNKVYFENRNGMDLIHYNLIYQVVECLVRALVTLPLIFMNDMKIMILFVIFIMFLLLIVYVFHLKKKMG